MTQETPLKRQDSNMVIFSTKLRHSGYTTKNYLRTTLSEKQRTRAYARFVEKWSYTRTLAALMNSGDRAEIDERISNHAIFHIISDSNFFSAGQNCISAELKHLNIFECYEIEIDEEYTMKFLGKKF